MRPLRFCMVTTFYPPFSFGGDAMCVYRLAHALGDQGHTVDVFHSEDAYRLQHPGDPETQFDEHENVTRYPLRSASPLLGTLKTYETGTPSVYRRQMERLLSGDNYDVIHYHNVSLMGAPGLLREGNAAKLYTAHEYWLICPTHVLFTFNREACNERKCLRCTLHAKRPPQMWRYSSLLDSSIPHVDRFIMPSRFALERHRAAGIAAPMEVLPNFIPSERQTGDDEPANDRPFFLFVGRLEKLKGVQDIIRVFRDYEHADLLVVGDGGYRETLETEAQSMANVTFIGHVHPSKLASYYRQAIAVLVPSLCYEVFPLIPAESFMHGTPVIARRIGALTEVIEESGGGLTFTNDEDCRNALQTLQNDQPLRNSMGVAGRKTAETHWTTAPHLQRYLAIVGDVIQEKAKASSR